MRRYFKYTGLLLAFVWISCERALLDEEGLNNERYEAFFNTEDELKIHEFEIHLTQTEWDRLLSILKVNIESDQYVKADFIYRKTPGGEEEIHIEEIGFRIRGNTTRRLPYDNGNFQRAHFKVKFDKRFDQVEGTEAYEKRRKRDFADLEALNLKWGREGNQADVSQIREIYQYDMLSRADLKVPKTTSVHVILVGGGEAVDYGM